jgi:hypothetical protein
MSQEHEAVHGTLCARWVGNTCVLLLLKGSVQAVNKVLSIYPHVHILVVPSSVELNRHRQRLSTTQKTSGKRCLA